MGSHTLYGCKPPPPPGVKVLLRKGTGELQVNRGRKDWEVQASFPTRL